MDTSLDYRCLLSQETWKNVFVFSYPRSPPTKINLVIKVCKLIWGTSSLYVESSKFWTTFHNPFFFFEEFICCRHLQIIHGSERGEPSALLLSPLRPSFKNPPNVDAIENGSQFTLFLTSPLLAFCQLVGLSESDRETVSFQLIHQTNFIVFGF